MRHLQRIEDRLLHVLIEGHPGDALHDVPCQTRPVVGICGYCSRRKNTRRDVRLHVAGEWGEPPWVRLYQVLDGLFEPWRVRHQIAQRDWLAESVGDFVVEIRIHIAIEIELALLGQ